MRRSLWGLGMAAALASGAALLAAGCPASQPQHDAPPVSDAAPAVHFDDLSFGDKKATMTKIVFPKLKALFQGYDADYFDDFSCATCHGDQAEERRYAMPNPDLLALYPTGHEEQKKLVAHHKKDPNNILKFMFGTVTPTMQELLGEQPFDAQTQTGFSCFSCHPKGS